MANLLKELKLYGKFLKYNIKARSMYSIDHWIGVISNLTVQIVNVFVIVIFFEETNSLGGWTKAEMIFLFSYVTLVVGLSNVLFSAFYYLPSHYINSGDLDRIMIKPKSLIYMILVDRAEIQGLSSLFIALLGFAYSLGIGLDFTWGKVPQLLAYMVISLLMSFSLHLMAGAISFKLRNFTGLLDFLYSMNEILKYPLSIFPKFLMGFLTYVLPLTVLGYSPISILLNKGTNTGTIFLLVSTGLALLLSMGLWKIFLEDYRSVGS